MTTQLVRDSMKLMADAGVDIVDIKWFDLSGAFTDKQRADLDPVMTHRPPFDKCFVTWKGKTRSHPSYEVLMLVAGADPNEGITVSMWKGPSGTRLRPIPAMFYFIEDDNIRYGSVSDSLLVRAIVAFQFKTACHHFLLHLQTSYQIFLLYFPSQGYFLKHSL